MAPLRRALLDQCPPASPRRPDRCHLGLLFKALVEHHCPTVSLLAQRLGVPFSPPPLVAIGSADDPRSRWAEVEGLVGWLQLAVRAVEPPRDRGRTWEEMTERERMAWLRNAQEGLR
jgi:hypothetical protein